MRAPTAAMVMARRASVSRLDEHRDPEHHGDHGEEGPRHDPERASAAPEIRLRQVRRGEPAENRPQSQRGQSLFRHTDGFNCFQRAVGARPNAARPKVT